MYDRDDERGIRDAFARLRGDEEGRLPGYRAIRSRASAESAPTRISIGWWLPASGVALAVLLSVLLMSPGSRPPPTALLEPGQWVMPSDILLDLSGVPGSSVMGELEWKPGQPGLVEGAHRDQTLDGVSGRSERSLG